MLRLLALLIPLLVPMILMAITSPRTPKRVATPGPDATRGEQPPA